MQLIRISIYIPRRFYDDIRYYRSKIWMAMRRISNLPKKYFLKIQFNLPDEFTEFQKGCVAVMIMEIFQDIQQRYCQYISANIGDILYSPATSNIKYISGKVGFGQNSRLSTNSDELINGPDYE